MRGKGAGRGVRQMPGRCDRHPEILGRIPRSRGSLTSGLWTGTSCQISGSIR